MQLTFLLQVSYINFFAWNIALIFLFLKFPSNTFALLALGIFWTALARPSANLLIQMSAIILLALYSFFVRSSEDERIKNSFLSLSFFVLFFEFFNQFFIEHQYSDSGGSFFRETLNILLVLGLNLSFFALFYFFGNFWKNKLLKSGLFRKLLMLFSHNKKTLDSAMSSGESKNKRRPFQLK
jgi:hypothetical protein